MDSRLYYECHVTIDPIFGEELNLAKIISKQWGFKVAELLMQKRKEDTPERSKYDTFMTGHAKNYEDLCRRMTCLIGALEVEGYVIRRAKIEDTLFDTKHGDTLEELSGATITSSKSTL